jgi:hypothetical protein
MKRIFYCKIGLLILDYKVILSCVCGTMRRCTPRTVRVDRPGVDGAR